MAPFGRFYSYPNNYRVQRCEVIAAMNGLTVELVPGFQAGVTNQSPEYLAKFPLGKIPGFESGDGSFHLAEGQAIARYVAESGPKADQLLGAAGDAKTRALIDMWSCFAEQELAANLTPPGLMSVKILPYDEARYNMHIAAFERALGRVEAELKDGRKFLVGGQLTLADIMIVGVLQASTKYIMDKEMRKQVPGVEAYLKNIMEVPEMKEAFGSLELIEARAKLE
ncbi:glutathione S-transferase [Parachaetomium inaequale]|uniref:Glutathione S-transferase n=1 Tax=Parachaetomium inaequale TaxID=2588326 RepID=A0AAN6SPD0_9PEZI|nr:glutathione S-transferase [Parachaetomium inaequale]